MAAIAVTAISLYPDRHAEWYEGQVGRGRGILTRRLALAGVTAADTAAADVLGLATVQDVSNGINATSGAVVSVAVDPVNNRIVIGTGPSAQTVYLTVSGPAKPAATT